jgi:anti-sigma factor RsiW
MCLSEETVEAYSLGRLPEGEIATVEEHLLWCERCQRQLKVADDFRDAMRSALRNRPPDDVAESE